MGTIDFQEVVLLKILPLPITRCRHLCQNHPAPLCHFSVSTLPSADTLRPSHAVSALPNASVSEALTEAHTRRGSRVQLVHALLQPLVLQRDTPETEIVGRQGQREAVSGHDIRRRAGGKAGDNRPAVGGKGGGHRRADCPCANLTDPASLQDSRAGQQPEGAGITEKGKQPAAQKKRTCTTRQATQTQPLLLAADAFVAALGAVPAQGTTPVTF